MPDYYFMVLYIINRLVYDGGEYIKSKCLLFSYIHITLVMTYIF